MVLMVVVSMRMFLRRQKMQSS